MLKFLLDSNNRNFLRLWLAQLISQFGDRIYQLALVGLIAERAPGSTTGLAKLMAFTILPVFLIQPIAGVLVDRWDRRVTLFVCDLIRGVLVLAIPFVFIDQNSMVPIYIIVFLIFSFSRFYVPAKMSIIPDLVHTDHLLIANSLVTTTGMIAFVLGCALGGFIIETYGARQGFIIDAAAFFISGTFLFSMKMSFKNLKFDKSKIFKTGREIVQKEKSVWSEIRAGCSYLLTQKVLRFIFSIFFILLFAAGSVYIVLIVFIQEAFNSVTKDLGVLAVSLGAGLFVGVLAYGKWGGRLSWYKTIFFCLMIGGILLGIFAFNVHNHQNIGTAILLAFIMGLVAGPIFIASNTVIHIVSDEGMRGKVFSALEIVIHFAFLIAMLGSSYLSEKIDSVWILIAVGSLFSLVGIMGFLRFDRKRGLAFMKE